MAIYHCSTKTFSRGCGDIATLKAAYRSAEKLYDERTGQTFDYARRGGVLHMEIFAPEHAPGWVQDRARLWNAAEAAERYKNAVIAREIEVSLPWELNEAQRLDLARAHGRYLAERYGVAVDMAMHAPHRKGDERNFHVHYLLTTRKIEAEGFGEKCELELSGKKKKELDLPSGKQQVKEIRKDWADEANRHLERAGRAERIDHRSLKDRGIDREATQHMGAGASRMERAGAESRIGQKNRAIEARNDERAQREAQAKVISLAIEREKRQQAAYEAQQQAYRQAAGGRYRGGVDKAVLTLWAARQRAGLQSRQWQARMEQDRALDAAFAAKAQAVRAHYLPGLSRDLRALQGIEERQRQRGLRGWLERLRHRDDAQQAEALRRNIADASAKQAAAVQSVQRQQAAQRDALRQRHQQEQSALERRIAQALKTGCIPEAERREAERQMVREREQAQTREARQKHGRGRGRGLER